MTKNKHTPGPWVVHSDAYAIDIRSANPDDLAEAPLYYVIAADIGGHVHGEQFDDYSEVKANATLIAAAPDLLVDLQEAAATLRRYEVLHRAKGTDESTTKAEVNASLASRFESTIAKATQ